MNTATLSDRQVCIERVFDAPCSLVFDAWADPKRLVQWYAPIGCGIAFRSIDVCEGGRFHSCIATPDGHECWCIGEYRVVDRPDRLVFTMLVADADGNAIDPVRAGMDPDWPRETVVTVVFEERGGKTTIRLEQTVSESIAKRTGAHPSWLQMFDRLAEELLSMDAN